MLVVTEIVAPASSITVPRMLPIGSASLGSYPSFDIESTAKAIIGFQAKLGFFSPNRKITIRITKTSWDSSQEVFTEEFQGPPVGMTGFEGKSVSRKLEIELDNRFMYRVGIELPSSTVLEDIVFSIVE